MTLGAQPHCGALLYHYGPAPIKSPRRRRAAHASADGVAEEKENP
jgi:hypothetical protein